MGKKQKQQKVLGVLGVIVGLMSPLIGIIFGILSYVFHEDERWSKAAIIVSVGAFIFTFLMILAIEAGF